MAYLKAEGVKICGFGVGLSWGSMHFGTDRISCPALVEV
jgi:hypothetical protein